MDYLAVVNYHAAGTHLNKPPILCFFARVKNNYFCMKKRKKKKSATLKTKRRNTFVLLAAIAVGLIVGPVLYFYVELYHPNVNGEGGYFYIRTGSTKEDVVAALENSGLINNMSTMQSAIERLEYGKKVYAGRFQLTPDMGNKQIVRILASNMQAIVELKITSVRKPERFAGLLSRQIEIDSVTMLSALKNEELASQYGFNAATFMSMFLPDTYQVYWNISLTDFVNKMHKAWAAYWQRDNHEEKLKALKMTKIQAVTLASIVNAETAQVDEMTDIAGVYINRLRAGMRLQADPTVKFAVGEGVVERRILTAYTRKKHPYNTYLIYGLPPGPINLPEPHHIDAVLNYHHHDYLFFCAKDDFSGYHAFAKTYQQHLVNARKYQAALNKRGIFK
ncbi:aminodeoxychorismate lyase [Bacteroidia bacterium]|nr:aminodeoxychorismate lyase [Bacteroidia bacterium]